MRVWMKVACALCVIVLWSAAPARAQVRGGVQAGGSVGPGQLFLGMHIETTPIVGELVFRPSLEVGFGDDLTLVTVNPEFVYRFPRLSNPWRVYAGLGPALNIYRWNANVGGGTSTNGGFTFVGGLEHDSGWIVEFRAGLANSPSLRFGVGYTW
jgi:hypothetical protein